MFACTIFREQQRAQGAHPPRERSTPANLLTMQASAGLRKRRGGGNAHAATESAGTSAEPEPVPDSDHEDLNSGVSAGSADSGGSGEDSDSGSGSDVGLDAESRAAIAAELQVGPSLHTCWVALTRAFHRLLRGFPTMLGWSW